MGPIRDSNHESLSSITLSFLEATGWYKAVYANAEPMNWGRDAGCSFVDDKCIDEAGEPIDSRHFCNTLYSNYDWKCTVDRMAIGNCDLYGEHTDVPAHFQYFDNPAWGGYYTSPDYCPKYWLWADSHQCRFSQYAPATNSKSEDYCEECRCFESTLGGGASIGCYHHVCEPDGSVTITASNGGSVSCGVDDAGVSKSVAGLTGAIQCPEIGTICPQPSCFDGEKNGDEEEIDCGGSCDVFCNVRTVTVSSAGFSPQVLEARRGDFVRWAWNSTTTTFNIREALALESCSPASNAFYSGVPVANGTYTRQFKWNGVHPYHCEVHCSAGMHGTPVRYVMLASSCAC